MKKAVSFLGKALVCGATFLFSFTSCEKYINEDYDLTKDIDMTVNLLPGLEVPVGNVSKVSLADLLDMELADNDLISADDNGNLTIQYGDNLQFSIETIDFGSFERQSFEPVYIGFPLSRYNLSGTLLPGITLSYSDLTGVPFTASTSTGFEAEIPDVIADIESVDMHTEVTLTFSSSEGKAYVKSGFRIQFPEYVSVQNYYENPEFIVENGNTIVLVQDVPTPIELTFFLNRIVLPAGALADGKIAMNLHLELEGDVYINTDDFTDLSKDIDIVISTNDILLKPSSASIKIDAEFEPEGTEIEIPELPDFLVDNNVCLDLYDPTLYLSVDNWTDFQFGLQAEITSYQSTLSPSVSLGTDPEIIIGRQSTHNFLISSRVKNVEDGVVNIVRPTFRDMFREIPERISIDDMKLIFSPDEEFFHFNLGVSYSVGYEYMLTLPLIFGESLNIQYTFDVNISDVDLEPGISNAVLDFELLNSVPVTFDLVVEALDTEDNPIDWIDFDLNAKIASGTQDAPVASPVSLNFKSHKEKIAFSGLRFTISAAAPSAEHLGVSLNKNQGIELKNLTLTVPEGITINPENF